MRSPPAFDATPALRFGFEQLVRGGLRGVWVRGTVLDGSFVWAANHHSWWDAFVANVVLRSADRDAALLMDAENLQKFSFLRRSGAIPADQPRAALSALRGGRTLVIFPEGELRSPGAVGAVAPGAAWLARQAAVPLVCAATRVVLRGQQSPEAYVDLTMTQEEGDLQQALARRVAALDGELAASDPSVPLPGFTCVMTGRSSWDERIGGWLAMTRR